MKEDRQREDQKKQSRRKDDTIFVINPMSSSESHLGSKFNKEKSDSET